MKPKVVSVTIGASSTNSICTSQTPGAAGNLTINGSLASGGVATLANPGRVSITSAGNDSTHTFTIVGTNRYGASVSETITGPNTSSVISQLDYATVTQISINATATGAITVGNAGTASSGWVTLDHFSTAPIALQAVVSSGSPTYSVEQTLDIVSSATSPVTVTASSDSAVVGATATKVSNFTAKPSAVRATITSGTGTVTLSVLDYGPWR